MPIDEISFGLTPLSLISAEAVVSRKWVGQLSVLIWAALTEDGRQSTVPTPAGQNLCIGD
ncbi:hypothetical protein MESS4_120276 [Mesorhizobium sp. STM 4661]|nr:hypothetical protein MESS4_120276 [Mesorhizobium sp. STM 4661]